ncbi:hypothetical protein [Xylocopilactobacillus apicola]|uniref:Uncharacterized protein n=1 Tax=Xylocopilactobacillus apicola TaxID=2932184 RepID=A0AAU9CWN9_9LACO|nr:hypothetical protein [Xylocopilactobacillus apicola]BDR58402.1 hypothetical protein XA3_08430 [Xylocopilactobacillus apicola]
MKLVKKLGYVLVTLSGIYSLFFALNFKQDSKAADFPANVATLTNGSDFRGGAIS